MRLRSEARSAAREHPTAAVFRAFVRALEKLEGARANATRRREEAR
ncbi:MAG TPA: hypothetical protein VF601_18645 [Beijerinckiaceae bacterium]|jgi:hypothetical protein